MTIFVFQIVIIIFSMFVWHLLHGVPSCVFSLFRPYHSPRNIKGRPSSDLPLFNILYLPHAVGYLSEYLHRHGLKGSIAFLTKGNTEFIHRFFCDLGFQGYPDIDSDSHHAVVN